ncbi:MAG: RsmB/NOP family class I SAM-dependent RNA methyltransferase [Asticcacaulis sp.]
MASPPKKAPRKASHKITRPKTTRPKPSAPPATPEAAPTEADTIGMTARVAALDLIEAAREKRSGFDEALSKASYLGLTETDRSFARALTMLVLRRFGQLDTVIARKTKKTPPEPVMALLRLGLAQIGFMGVPDFAAVSTTVKLAERLSTTRPYKGLINAILRGVIRDGGLKKPDPNRLAPDWLFARWKTNYGDSDAKAIAMVLTEEPATDLTFKTAGALNARAEAVQGTPLGGLSMRSGVKGDIREWPGFEDGEWWVQDAAAAVPVALLGDLDGKTAVDLCAAPGGKTLQLLARGAKTVALDRSKSRLKRVEENLVRAGYQAEMVMADAETWEDARQFDIVLLDAPCSSTGTFRRQPDVLWATRPADIAKLADVQHRLLDASAPRVAPGGVLVYCTCSLEREEGETQVLAFLRRHADFEMVKVDPEAAHRDTGVPIDSVRPEGWLRLLPHQRPCGQDGFFIALMKRSR